MIYCSFDLLLTGSILLGKFSPKNHNCLFKMKFDTQTNSNGDVQIFSLGPEISFSDKFGLNNQNFLLKMKIFTYTNTNIVNLVVTFVCPAVDMKYPFGQI